MAVIAPALDRLRVEINATWPGRDRRTDGWIGDTSHQSTGRPENGGSDHNPNHREVVDAYDIDVDGIDCPRVVAAAIKHPSTHYVIWNRTIWSREYGFRPRRYTGSNPHIDHIHVSILQTVTAENSTRSWGVAPGIVVVPAILATTGAKAEPTWAQRLARAMPVLKKSPTRLGSVRKAQALLNAFGAHLSVDGVFGDLTAAAVRDYQTRHHLSVDGIIGPQTWGELLDTMPTTKAGSAATNITRVIQALLNASGAHLTVDGAFGPKTAIAVRDFQDRFGLTPDGIVGPLTWTALLTR